MDNLRIIQTEDGTSTIYNPELNETYHSLHGALAESEHVYIQAGLRPLAEQGFKAIQILEVGLGTGLNLLLTLRIAQAFPDCQFSYRTLEPFPLPAHILDALDYPELFKDTFYKNSYTLIHNQPWEQAFDLLPNLTCTKYQQKIQDFATTNTFDLVYFDAFAPSKQADMWDASLFQKLYGWMQPSASLVTYCAQGQFKRNLKAAGFEVEILKGPLGKKEMVKATK